MSFAPSKAGPGNFLGFRLILGEVGVGGWVGRQARPGRGGGLCVGGFCRKSGWVGFSLEKSAHPPPGVGRVSLSELVVSVLSEKCTIDPIDIFLCP